jgi:alanine racemase
VDGFGVVRLEEAIHIREQSHLPILMMQGVYSTEAYDELKRMKFGQHFILLLRFL